MSVSPAASSPARWANILLVAALAITVVMTALAIYGTFYCVGQAWVRPMQFAMLGSMLLSAGSVVARSRSK